jgi:hypothetical protein
VSDDSRAPVFVLGISRSGTTLVSAMLVSHPAFGFIPEWDFIPDVIARAHGDGPHRRDVVDDVMTKVSAKGWAFDRDAVHRRFDALDAPTSADAVRIVLEETSSAAGHRRWGDKTPANVRHIPALAAAFPDARIVHVIRDGREVADANRDAPWPGRSIRYWASYWADGVRRGCADGRVLGARYVELRYEDLVADADATRGRLLEFLGEEVVGSATDYVAWSQTMADRIPAHHRGLLLPPTPGLRDWRKTWSRRDRTDVEALAGAALDELGYARSVPVPSPRRVRLLRRWVAFLRRVRPLTRWGWWVSLRLRHSFRRSH